MRRTITTGLATCAVLLIALPVTGQEPGPIADAPQAQQQERLRARIHDPALSEEERQEMREQWQNMSSEERARIREERRQRWDTLTPEERAQIREERRARWESMDPEERVRIREEHRRKWESMSPEEREELRQRPREHHRLDGDRGPHRRGSGRGRDGQV